MKLSISHFVQKFGLLLCIFLFTCMGIVRSQVVINEYSCSNVSFIPDNNGNFVDWIELYNTSSAAVSLNGYYLSENKKNPMKWALGNVSISANGFLRIWASGLDINSGANLHAGFTMKQCKPDGIIFSNPSGIIIDSLTLKPTQVDHSRGRTTDGANTWSVFLSPSPGLQNSGGENDYTPKPLMSPVAGFYPAAQNVSISCSDPTATIYYTLDGSTPDPSSNMYAGPINLSSNTVVRSIAYSGQSAPGSFIESNTYFINSSHQVPVVSIFGDQIQSLMNGNIFSPEAGLEYFDSSGTFQTEGYGLSNKHGNDSWFYNQRGIDFICKDEYGINDALKHRFFEGKSRTEFQRIILKAAANDNYSFEGSAGSHFPGELGGAHIRDAYVQTVSQKAGLHLDERTWLPCVLYVNGTYWGLYDFREKVDDKDFTKYYYKTQSDSLQMLKTWGNTWSAYGGNQAQADWNSLASYILSNNMVLPAKYNYVESMYSVKSLADYVILNSFSVCSDWLNWNTLWWRGLNSACDKKKWRYGLWDEDATFRHYINYTNIPNSNVDADPCDPEALGNPGNEGHIPILNALLKNPSFKKYYVMRYFDLLNTGLSCQRLTDILDSMIYIIAPEMPGQIQKWGGTLSEWQTNVADLRSFILARCDTVVNKFNACYNVTGPYPIQVNVDPVGSGTIDINSLHLSSFVWRGKYPGNLNVDLTAHPNPNYCFSHWEIKNNLILPSVQDSAVTVNLHAQDSIIAHFVINPKPVINPLSPHICQGQDVHLQAAGGTSFLWKPASGLSCSSCANPIASPVLTTVYTLTVTNASGCQSNATDTVTVVPDAVASFTETISGNVVPCQIDFKNTSTNSSSNLWVFDDVHSSSMANPTYLFTQGGPQTVTLIAFGVNGCNDTLKKTFTFLEPASLSFPNVFSPNADGINDFFEPLTHAFLEMHGGIYNRWGVKVYTFADVNDRWDGTMSNGLKCESGTYYYIFTAKDKLNKELHAKGFFQLLR